MKLTFYEFADHAYSIEDIKFLACAYYPYVPRVNEVVRFGVNKKPYVVMQIISEFEAYGECEDIGVIVVEIP
jgi:hypothetical protein